MRKLLAVGSLALIGAGLGFSQAAPTIPAPVTQPAASVPPPQLSPEAAYQQAIRPVDIVRRSMSNWSDSEVGAFAVAMKQAAAACLARTPDQFSGDDLISYAKLCSVGQKWELMGVAAGRYIDSSDMKKPQLTTAYGYKLESELHAQDVTLIMGIHQAMIMSQPYDSVVETVSNETLAYLQLAHTEFALGLVASRQPAILEELKSTAPRISRNALYADGLAKASLEQYAGRADDAVATVVELDAALTAGAPNGLAPDDAIPVQLARQQYALLGKPLPRVQYELSLKDVREKARIDEDSGAATALVLFPDWCAQCVRMAPDLWDVLGRMGSRDIRVYGLVAETLPDKAKLLTAQMKPMGPLPAGAPPRTPTESMLHTPVLVVPPETLATFAATDYPFLIVVDHTGVVRFAAPAPESVLQPGDFLDRVVLHVAEQWPRPKRSQR